MSETNWFRCGNCRGFVRDSVAVEHDRSCGAMRGMVPSFTPMAAPRSWEFDAHERHLNLTKGCGFCRAEAAAQPDRLS